MQGNSKFRSTLRLYDIFTLPKRCIVEATTSSVKCKTSYYFLIVLSPAFTTALIVDHHTPKLALMFAGLLPHDGTAWGGGTAGHGCCTEDNNEET